ncbi:zinc ribbon domain-containing protein [Candidatus Pantoea bituminis]|uniref:zinc ribbon domain-containing protein n=1 Tax=Candidatus Pantoea bituminis TaxID=2831036 RepID=UPI001C063E2E|nr:zinc ribbon domain-containing protein [Pantoea bituminis]
MNVTCEKCQQTLTLSEGAFICEACDFHLPAQAVCPDCLQPLNVLKACGAVDYFCPQGHGLISKKE